MKLPALAACGALILPSLAFAGDRTLMHCFAWTPIKQATPAGWEAFCQIDGETLRKCASGETVSPPLTRTPRECGMCMEMKDANTLKACDTDPSRKIWTAAYAKIRVGGTTTFNILGQ